MKKALTVTFAGVLAFLVLCAINYAQEEPDVPTAKRPNEEDAAWPAETWEDSIGAYEYVIASVLDEKREEFMGKYVKIVDDLAVLWDESTPHDSKEEREETEQKGYKGDYDNQTVRAKHGYVKFETYYFRCLLPEEYRKSVRYLENLNSKNTYDDVTQIKPEPKIVCIYGRLVRTTVWGKIAKRGEGIVEPEDVVIIVHKVERPAERFFKEEPKEEDE